MYIAKKDRNALKALLLAFLIAPSAFGVVFLVESVVILLLSFVLGIAANPASFVILPLVGTIGGTVAVYAFCWVVLFPIAYLSRGSKYFSTAPVLLCGILTPVIISAIGASIMWWNTGGDLVKMCLYLDVLSVPGFVGVASCFLIVYRRMLRPEDGSDQPS